MKKTRSNVKGLVCLLSTLLALLWAANALASEVTIFGPYDYVRGKGKPVTYTETFEAITGDGKIIIKNGDENGKNRISSAEITVNGVIIAAQKNFNQKVDVLEVPVSLNENNTVSISLNSKPGAFITLQVVQEDENIPDTTVIIDQPTLQSLVSISPDGTEYIFGGTSDQLEGLSPGDVIVFDVSDVTPDGALRKVEYVYTSGSQTIVVTSQATIEEAIENADVEITRQLNAGDVEETIDLVPSLTPARLFSQRAVSGQAAAEEDDLFELILNAIVYDDDGNLDTTNDQVRIEGSLSFTTFFAFTLGIEDQVLTNLAFEQTVEENAAVKVIATNGLEFEKKKEIKKIKFKSIKIMVGWFPVIVRPILHVYIGANGAVVAQLEAGITQTATITAGVEYANDEWGIIKEFNNDFNFTGPTLDASAQIKGWAGPQLDLMLYGIVGPNVMVDGYAELLADINEDPWWKLYAGLEVKAGVKVKILSKLLADVEFDIIDLRKLLAQAPIDRDDDGYTKEEDCDDLDASVNPGAAEVCDDAKDNNCNEDIDCDDSACSAEPVCIYTDEICNDSIDNDGDGDTDCDDSDCSGDPSCTGAGLVAHYPFNGNANDESGNGHDGTVNGATLTTDRFGNPNSAYSFDGVDDYIALGDSDNLLGVARNISISIWVYTHDNTLGQKIFNGEREVGTPSAYNTGYGISIMDDGSIKASVGTGVTNAGSNAAISSSTAIDSNAWEHIVIVRNDTDIRIYINGELDSSRNDFSSYDISYYGSAHEYDKYAIGNGCYNSWICNTFNGLLDDLRIYNRALSESEIQELYNGESSCNNEFASLDNHQAPAGWEFINNGAFFQDGKLWAYPTDHSGGFTKDMTGVSGLTELTFEMDCLARYSYWGTKANVQVFLADGSGYRFIHGVEAYDHGTSNFVGIDVLPGQGDAFAQHYVREDGEFHFKVELEEGIAKLTAHRISDGEQVAYLEQELPGLIMDDIVEVKFHVAAHTQNGIWIDNLYFEYCTDVPDTGGDGLVAYYPFNGNADDESGNGNHGTVNGASLTEDRFGNEGSAYHFDGVDDIISWSTGGLFGFPSYNEKTTSLWFKCSNIDHGVIFCGSLTGTSTRCGIYFNIDSSTPGYDGSITIRAPNPAGGNYVPSEPIGSGFDDNNWHNIVVVRDSDGMNVYIDAQLRFTSNVAFSADMRCDDSSYLGGLIDFDSGQFPSGYGFTGSLDDVRIYNRALSEGEIQELYNEAKCDGRELIWQETTTHHIGDTDTPPWPPEVPEGTSYSSTFNLQNLSDLKLTMEIFQVEYDYNSVFVNNNFIAYLPYSKNEWSNFMVTINSQHLQMGQNTLEIVADDHSVNGHDDIFMRNMTLCSIDDF
ncbi:LamG-like jellyroll fold domain-containing protein [Thermodesulfobacteriota bacterium]